MVEVPLLISDMMLSMIGFKYPFSVSDPSSVSWRQNKGSCASIIGKHSFGYRAHRIGECSIQKERARSLL